MAAQIGNALLRQCGEEARQVSGLARGRQHQASVTGQSQRIVGLDDGGDIATGRDQRVRDREQERPGAGDDDALAWEHTAALDERLRAATGHNAGEGPTGERQLSIEGTRRDDH